MRKERRERREKKSRGRMFPSPISFLRQAAPGPRGRILALGDLARVPGVGFARPPKENRSSRRISGSCSGKQSQGERASWAALLVLRSRRGCDRPRAGVCWRGGAGVVARAHAFVPPRVSIASASASNSSSSSSIIAVTTTTTTTTRSKSRHELLNDFAPPPFSFLFFFLAAT